MKSHSRAHPETYDISKVIAALVMSVYCVKECTICNLIVTETACAYCAVGTEYLK